MGKRVTASRMGVRAFDYVMNLKIVPYDSGYLYSNAITCVPLSDDELVVSFSGRKAPYIEYLQEGTFPHDIPHAFGYGTIYPDRENPYTGEIPFGVGGRFDGKFHPGSTKHKGFIDKYVKSMVRFICRTYKGTCEELK